ncbi:hypothetical protein [Paenibacillus illinoisensis]|uniref:hypothetical protein n=1 Tax=Paenibacillus illinoisensis TaxID=59845 RepID=UPI00301820F9
MMKKNTNTFALWASVLCILLLISACGAKNNNESVQEHAYPQSKQPIEEAGKGSIPNSDAKQSNEDPANTADGDGGKLSAQSESSTNDEQITIQIDQSDKPTENNQSFDFSVSQVPEGYNLSELRWTSNQITIINSPAEAIQHGGDGKEGFYISGNGQFSGFKYSDEMKGERGKITLVYKNEAGKEILAEQEVQLKK